MLALGDGIAKRTPQSQEIGLQWKSSLLQLLNYFTHLSWICSSLKSSSLQLCFDKCLQIAQVNKKSRIVNNTPLQVRDSFNFLQWTGRRIVQTLSNVHGQINPDKPPIFEKSPRRPHTLCQLYSACTVSLAANSEAGSHAWRYLGLPVILYRYTIV